jgi:Predicted membrane protein (DUF2157)
MGTEIGNEFPCPACSSPTSAGQRYCRGCGILLAGSQAAEFRWIAAELRRVDEARTWLISRRAQLLDEVASLRRHLPEDGWITAPAGSGPAPARRSRSPELSGRTAARLLLGVGAVLVVIAATIFTVAGWREIGPLGRSAILLAATTLVLITPLLLIRRGLNATAEAVGAVGLAMTIGDAALLQASAGSRPDPMGLAAYCAALAAAWALYGRAIALTGPRVAAIALAQLPLPLAIVGLVRPAGWSAPLAGPVAVGLELVAGGDVLLAGVLARRDDLRRQQVVIRTAAVAAIAMWLIGVLAAAAVLAVGPGRPTGQWLAAAFAAAAVVAFAGPPHAADLGRIARPAAAASGTLAAVSLAVPASEVMPATGGLAAFAVCGFGVSAVALAAKRRTSARAGRLDLLAGGSAAIMAGAGALAAPAALAALFGPRNVLHAWSGGGPHPPAMASLPGWPAGLAVPGTLALLSLACAAAPRVTTLSPRMRRLAGSAGLVAGALAAGSIPVAAHLPGWAALSVLSGAAAILLLSSGAIAGRGVAAAAGGSAVALALSAALWSLAAPVSTIAELAAFTIIGSLAAMRARHLFTAALSTAWTVVAAAGLAWAIPLAYGWAARDAAFAVLAVAVAAIAAATALRRVRPVHSVVLDVCAGPIVLLSVRATAEQGDSLAVMAVTVALIGSGTAWFRAGRRRAIAVLAAGIASLAAFAAQWRPLARALTAPGQQLTHPWQRRDLHSLAGHQPGLALALVIFTVGLAALVSAAGAWRRNGRASLDAVAFALPILAGPVGAAGLASGVGYWIVIGVLLTMTAGLTAWAALDRGLAPAGAALVGAGLTIAWALEAPAPTLVVLGCLTALYACCAWRARLEPIRIAAGCLAVLAAGALAWCAVLAAGRPAWQAGVAALAVAAGAQVAAAWADRTGRGALGAEPAVLAQVPDLRAVRGLCMEISAWLVTAAGVGACLEGAWTAVLGLGIAGATCLGVGGRASRRPAVWAGLALCYLAWCLGLAAAGVAVTEAYTGPGAAIVLVAGWRASARRRRPHSWLAYGPGLSLLLLPSLVLAWQDPGWIRPVLVGVVAAGVAVAGARARMQAPLIVGAIVAVLDAGRQLAPACVRLVPGWGWIMVAVLGAALLWAGATYEARLRDLKTVRRSLAAMS